ncbi:MAG: cytochrome c [Gammaproteobacteria bacterium]|nr:cytochrome c [Gammaproteobacteria bacterium]
MLKNLVIVVVVVLGLVASPADAQNIKETPEQKAFKFRTSLFQTFSWKLGQLHSAQSASDETGFINHANDLLVLAKMTGEGFEIANSMPEGTRAKSEIWEDPEGFSSKTQTFVDAVSSLTEEGAMESFKVRDFASKNCGGCHREYRTKK